MEQIKPTIHGHIHLCQTLFRGIAENRTLMPWLEERIWPLEAAHTPETLTVSVILSLREIIETGSTGLLDMGSVQHSSTTVNILKESGIRAVVCNALMDKGPDFIKKPLPWLINESEKVENGCEGLIQYGLAPRFVLSCTPELWQWLETKNKNTIRTTHAAEAPGEMADPWIAKYGGNIHLLNKLNFLGDKTLLAHCVHLQPKEMEVLVNTKTAVVHCPWTNLRLGSGIADIPELLKNNIRVILGSDGAPCNNRLDLSAETRLAASLASLKAPPGTIPGEKWTEISGKQAADFFNFKNFQNDKVHLNLTTTEEDELALVEDKQRYLNEIPRAGRVTKVECNGKIIFDHGEFPTLPKLPMSIKKAREIVWNRALALGMKP